MHIRDARVDDEPGIQARASGDLDPAHLRRERTVLVAVDEDGREPDDVERAAILGFLAFQTLPDAIHVTRLGGDDAALANLLDEAAALAGRDGLPVEAVVPDDGAEAVALEARGFEVVGSGPRFQGRETTRFRLNTV